MSGDISRFWVSSPEFTYGRRLVVLASAHDDECLRLRTKVAQLEEELKTERQRSRDWEEAARKARQEGRTIPATGFVEVAPPSRGDEKVVRLRGLKGSGTACCKYCGGPLVGINDVCLARCQKEQK